MPGTPSTVKGILRKPDTPSSNSRVVWGFRMTTEGDVSRISSLADSPTREMSLLQGGESPASPLAASSLPVQPPQSSRTLQSRQAHDTSDDDEDEANAVEASLPSLPSGTSLGDELRGVGEADASTSRLPSLPADSDDPSATNLMDGELPSMATIVRPSKKPAKAMTPQQQNLGSNDSPTARLLPWGKQSPGSRLASSSSEGESSFSVNDSFLAREAGKFMSGWKQAEAAASGPDEQRAKPSQQARGEDPQLSHVQEKQDEATEWDEQAGNYSQAQSTHDEGGNDASHNSQPHSFQRPSPPPGDNTPPSRVGASQADSITAWQEEVSHHDLDTPNKPRSTFPSPAVGLGSSPGVPNDELSFSTAFISSPAAQRAQRKSLRDLIQPAPLPSSRRSTPRRVSPPLSLPSPERKVKEEPRDSRFDSPVPSEGAVSYKTARTSVITATTPRRPSPLSKVIKRSASAASTPIEDSGEALKRLNAVRFAIEEYMTAHDERLGTLSSRARVHQSEASQLRAVLHDELESKCQILQELAHSRTETQQWKQKATLIQNERESERTVQDQSDEKLRKLVEKMRMQLQRRASQGAVAVKSDPDADAARDAEIEALRADLDRERQERSREQKDFEIKLAIASSGSAGGGNHSTSPRSVPLPASRESSPLQDSPARPSHQILEDAVRRARDSAERDHEIRLYSMQRDHEKAVEDLEGQVESVRAECQKDIEGLQGQIRELELQCEEARRQNEEKTREAEEARAESQRHVEASQTEMQQLSERCSSLQLALEEEERLVKEATFEATELRCQLEALQAERQEIEEELTSELERRHQSWTEGLQAVESERDEAMEIATELEERVQALEAEAAARGDKEESVVGEMRQQLEDAQARAKGLQTQLTEADEQHKVELAERDQLQRAHDRLKALIAEREQQLSDYEERSAKVNEDGNATNQSLESELKLARLDIEEARRRNEALEREVGDRGLSVSKLQRANERLEAEIQNHCVALSTKQQELSLLKRKVKLQQQQASQGLSSGVRVDNDTLRSSLAEEQTTEVLQKGPAPRRATGRRTMDGMAVRAAAQRSGAMPLNSSNAHNRQGTTMSTTTLGKRASLADVPSTIRSSTRSSSSMASSVASSKSKHSTFEDTLRSASDMDLAQSQSQTYGEEGTEDGDGDRTATTGLSAPDSKSMSLDELTRLSRAASTTWDAEVSDKENDGATPRPRQHATMSSSQHSSMQRSDSRASVLSAASSSSNASRVARRQARALNEIPGMESFLARKRSQSPEVQRHAAGGTGPQATAAQRRMLPA